MPRAQRAIIALVITFCCLLCCLLGVSALGRRATFPTATTRAAGKGAPVEKDRLQPAPGGKALRHAGAGAASAAVECLYVQIPLLAFGFQKAAPALPNGDLFPLHKTLKHEDCYVPPDVTGEPLTSTNFGGNPGPNIPGSSGPIVFTVPSPTSSLTLTANAESIRMVHFAVAGLGSPGGDRVVFSQAGPLGAVTLAEFTLSGNGVTLLSRHPEARVYENDAVGVTSTKNAWDFMGFNYSAGSSGSRTGLLTLELTGSLTVCSALRLQILRSGGFGQVSVALIDEVANRTAQAGDENLLDVGLIGGLTGGLPTRPACPIGLPNGDTGTGNQPPTVSAGAVPAAVEATGAAGAVVALNGSGADPNGDPLTFTWKDGAATIASSAVASPTLALGPHSLTLTANDGRGGVATTSAASVIVRDTTPPAFAGVPADVTQTISSGTTAAVNFSAPTATDLVDGPRSVTTTRSDGQAGNLFPLGQTTVTFAASDSRGNTAAASFKVTITNSPQPPSPPGASYDISAFAGSGGYGSSGGGGAAASATFKQPHGIAVDPSGNVYISDAEARVVRKVNAADGQISLFAGNGTRGSGGDGGPATAAALNNPTGLAADAAGNVYIADTGNHRVRRVAPNGTITTVAGSGVAGFAGDGGAATDAKLSYPTAVAADLIGDIYIADTGNSRIRKVAGTIISTLAGNGLAGFSGDGGDPTAASLNNPTGVAVDHTSANYCIVYIADQGNHRVREVRENRIMTLVGSGAAGFGGDGGPMLQATLNAPAGVAVDSDHSLLIVDSGNERIRRVRANTAVISTIAGNGSPGNAGDGGNATNASLDTPTATAVHVGSGKLYFTDSGNLRVRQLVPVQSANAAPIIAQIPPSTVNVGQPLDVSLSATDADGDAVIFAPAPGAPGFLSIISENPQARTATLRIAPTCASVGTHSIQVQASDGKTTATSATFSVSVTDSLNSCGAPANQPPTAVISPVPAAVETSNPGGANVTFIGTASSDPNGDALTYSWADNGTVFAATATAPRLLTVGQHTITLTVNDGKGRTHTASATVTVTLTGGGGALTLSTLSPASGKRGQTVQVTLTGANFGPEANVTFAGGAITVSNVQITPTQITLAAKVGAGATLSKRTVTVTNHDGQSASLSQAFEVKQ